MHSTRPESSGEQSEQTRRTARPLCDVAVVSDMCVDLIVRGNVRPHFCQREQIVHSYCLELGGSANIFASQIAKLGLRTAVIGYVGSDFFGDFVLKRLTESGVDISLVKRSNSVPTGLGVTLAEATDRAILTALGTIDICRPSDLPGSPGEICRHWHIASPFLLRNLQAHWKPFVEQLRADRVTVSLDPNWDPEEQWRGILELLPLIDVFLPNEAEAIALTGLSDVTQAACHLAKSCSLVVVKCGAQGAIAVSRGRVWRLDPSTMAPLTEPPVDTVGAGDNFDAGFLGGWIFGRDMNECLHLGHRCAAASLSAPGGIRGQWNYPDLTTKVRGLPEE